MNQESIFDELTENDFLLVFKVKDEEFEKLNSVSDDVVQLDLSISSDLEDIFTREFSINKFPVLLHKKKPIYLKKLQL